MRTRKARLVLGTAAAAAAVGLLVPGMNSASADEGSPAGTTTQAGAAGQSEADDLNSRSWGATKQEADGGVRTLDIVKDGTSITLSGDGFVCDGTLDSVDKPTKLTMDCPGDGYDTGSITDVDGTDFTVKWNSGVVSEFQKATNGHTSLPA